MTGCFVPLTAIAGGVPSNTVLLPIAPNGGPCTDPVSGVNGNQLPVFSTQTLKFGLLGIGQTTNADGTVTNGATATFQKYTGVFYSGAPGPGGCELLGGATRIPDFAGLAVGNILLTGPNNLNRALGPTGVKGAFYALLASDALPPTGGSFTFTTIGGADVGPFTATVSFTAPLFSWTNSAAVTTIDRSQGVDVTWTGGNPGSVVYISGGVTYNRTIISFTCTENAAAGHFKVPAFITSSLPAGSGSIGLQNQFMIPVNASGLDVASVTGSIATASVKATYQ